MNSTARKKNVGEQMCERAGRAGETRRSSGTAKRGLVAVVAAIALVASAFSATQTVPRQSPVDQKYELEFLAARRGMGGSVLEALVKKLNGGVEDGEMSQASARTARETAMKKIAGAIGPVKYEKQKITTNTTSLHARTSSGCCGGGSRTVFRPLSSKKTKVGGYVATVPNGFRDALDKMIRVARCGHPRANAEVGASIFVDAAKGQIGMDERRALALFEKAAELGDADGMYMQAFCLFYGIGRTSHSEKDILESYRILSIWRESPTAGSLKKSGWAQRRLDEARQLGY
jgi:TPR repeat protein